MSRLVRFSLVALILASLPYAGLGQPAGAGPGAPAVSDSETANIIRLNPKLDLLNRVQPQIIPAVVGRLRRYGQSLQDDLYRGNDRPTPAEKTELAANPRLLPGLRAPTPGNASVAALRQQHAAPGGPLTSTASLQPQRRPQ